jgi:hypothetical protein
MTGYSQGGYVVSVSSEYLSDVNALRNAYKVYNPTTDTAGVWMTEFSTFNPNAVGGDTFTDSDGGTHTGHWNKIELPYKLKPSYFYFKNSGTLTGSRNATNWVILGSNNDSEWDLLHSSTTVLNATKSIPITATKGYTYLMFLCKSVNADTALYMEEIRYYGHRENDLVRLPDPTNVLKYPHIAMTGPAQRGYVASASSTYTSEYQAFKMFADDGATNPSPYGGKGWWKSATGKYNTSDPFNYLGGTTDNLGTYTGSSTTTDNGVWIQLKMPHKILLSSVFLGMSAWHETAPGSFKIYGTNNDTDWTLIKAFTGQNPQSGTSFAINATVAYRTIGLVITHVAGGADGSSGISEIDFYGTGVDSIPIQIGGGNIDKVANFRVYDKFIGEDQVNEIWNAQKEEFGRAKPQMVLQQGKLGIGTDAPQGSLSVADEPDPTTYGLQEFPPRGVTGEETYMEEHGVFTASVSSVYNSGYEGWRAFDKNTTSALIGRWTALNSSSTIGSLSGKWVKLELPYRVNFSKVGIFPPAYSGGSAQCPTGFSIIVSNDDETWTTIKTLSSYTWKEFDYNYITFENDGYFKYIAIVATTDGSNGATSFQEILYLGYREQVTKQSVLHDGQLTLTKNLTVPRIGPEIGEYPTPRQDKIHLQYDTSLSIHADNHIMDTSGRSRDLSRSGNGYYNSGTESLHFDGNDSYYNTGIGDWSDNQHHTHSFWVKTTANSGNPVVLWNAVNNNHDYSGVSINAGSHFSFWHFGNDHNYNYNVQKNVWYHVAAVYNGNSKTQKMYINGEEIPVTGLGTISSLSMGTNPKISLGGDYGRSNYYFTGEISKYRLHSVDLTPEEVFTLYKQGRTTPVHHLQVVDSTMTIGSHNRHRDAQLDVAGHIRAGSGTIHTFTGQHRCFPDEPMEKGLIVSAKKNQFVKLNGLATGKSAITIDESLPIVSLSNMHQDKACFGVVSSIEKSTPRRSQIVNGIISDIKKEKGDNRAIVNSVGEGGIWVVDTNGPLESGDYITTSNVAGYGQKQDDDILHNFTVAKITMDCDFTASNVAVQTIKREETGTRIITEDAWNQLVEYDRYSNVEDEITTYYQIQRGGNVLDDNGQLQFEDKTGATEEPYERRFLTTDGTQTDEANAVHIAAFVGCTYHCG